MPMIEHLFVFSSYVLHFEWFKMSWECYLKLLKSSSKPKGKGLMKKITRRRKNFPNFQNPFFFFFLLLGHLLLSNLISFLFFIHLIRLKCYMNVTWSSIHHLWILITTKQQTRNYWGVWKLAFLVFSDLFLEFLTPYTLRGHIFFISNLFFTIVNG